MQIPRHNSLLKTHWQWINVTAAIAGFVLAAINMTLLVVLLRRIQ
jgi:hypothetical protein